jgi:predicted small secreted protein
MKRTTLVSGLLLVSLLLSACSVVGQGGQALAAQNTGNASSSGSTAQGLPLAMKLALGTFKLDKTNTPVDAAEATQLLFLWKGMRNLNLDQSVANAEIQGLTKQIQDTMTPEQITAINGMNLTFQDIAAIAKETGLNLGSFGGQAGNLSPQALATFQAARQAGGDGGGGIPGAGGGGNRPAGGFVPGAGGGGPSVSSTNISGASQTRGAGSAFSKLGISPTMIDAIIQFLQAKVK